MPKKVRNKVTQLNIRLTENENKFIRDEAKKQNLDVTKFILNSITPKKQNLRFVCLLESI